MEEGEPAHVPVAEDTFCDLNLERDEDPGTAFGFEVFEGSVAELVADKAIREGRMVELWPRAYMVRKNEQLRGYKITMDSHYAS